MTSKKRDFYGKEVADAIKSACEELGVPQEELDIEVVEPGSTGIFGLIRKKAHIRAVVKTVDLKNELKAIQSSISGSADTASAAVDVEAEQPQTHSEEDGQRQAKSPEPEKPVKAEVSDEDDVQNDKVPEDDAALDDTDDAEDTDDFEDGDDEEDGESPEESDDDDDEDDDEELEDEQASAGELPADVLSLIKEELSVLLDLMGYSSPVEVSAKGTSVLCHIGPEFEDVLAGQDGKTLDSMQYLLRKIVARKIPNRLRLTVDVGNYREKRIALLKEKALDLAAKVKANGKTQVIPALSPSERRVIHMSLQDDKEIRSRSVGDGLFKKILIYIPGKGSGKSGGRRRSSRGRKGQNSRKKNE